MCIWKKKKNDGFWTNRGFENIRGKKAEKSWVGTNCVFEKAKKMMGFGRTVDLKI